MKQYLTTDFAFAGTTVDPSPAVQYLFNTEFEMLKVGMMIGCDQLALDLLNRLEWVGLQIRHYVAGHTKTLHRTLREVRWYVRDYPEYAPALIPTIIEVIKTTFIDNEWYELMPRLEKAAVKIEKLLQ